MRCLRRMRGLILFISGFANSLTANDVGVIVPQGPSPTPLPNQRSASTKPLPPFSFNLPCSKQKR